MRATLYQAPQEVILSEVPTPVPGPKDVLVQVKNAAICGTDVSAYRYGGSFHRIDVGSQFGHEFAGEICEVGSEVPPEIKKGMRVFVNPSTAKRVGVNGCNTCGAFSEYVLVEDAALDYNLYLLADSLPFHEATLIEPYSVSTHGVNAARAKKGERAVVFGAGPIGLGAISALKAIGVEDVVVSDIMDTRLEAAAKLGATTVNPAKTNLGDFLREHFGSLPGTVGPNKADAEVYIDCAGIPSTVDDFCKYGKLGARLAVVAVHRKPVELDLISVLSQRLEIIGSVVYDPSDIKQVIGFLERKATNYPEVVVTHRFRLDDIKEAFATAANAEKSIKVVIDYD